MAGEGLFFFSDTEHTHRLTYSPFHSQETRSGKGTDFLLWHDQPSGYAGHETRIPILKEHTLHSLPQIQFSINEIFSSSATSSALSGREGSLLIIPADTIPQSPGQAFCCPTWKILIAQCVPHSPHQEYHPPSSPLDIRNSWAPILTVAARRNHFSTVTSLSHMG